MNHDEAQPDSANRRFDAEAEHQLLDSWREGDESALVELLECFQPRIWSICWRTLGNAEDASDLAQDALIKVIKGLPRFDGRSKLSTWVIRVTMNCCLSHLRKQKLRRHASLDARASKGEGTRGERLESVEPRPLSSVQQRDLQELLQASFLALEGEQRMLLMLRDVQGVEYAQLAEIYEVPIGTIKSRLFRARSALRTLLEDHGESRAIHPDTQTLEQGPT